MGSVSAYSAGGTHRHTAEIEQALSEIGSAMATGSAVTVPGASVSFTPMLAPMPRGILATCTARLIAAQTTTAQLRAAVAAAYADAEFACLLPAGQWPATASVAGSNVVVAAIDNLGKGAASQAIQNANLMLGLPEGAGLTASGVAP
jgi:N-acetyl-gamma-glutamyl-phosphate reductase